jgi:hypothetical protein
MVYAGAGFGAQINHPDIYRALSLQAVYVTGPLTFGLTPTNINGPTDERKGYHIFPASPGHPFPRCIENATGEFVGIENCKGDVNGWDFGLSMTYNVTSVIHLGFAYHWDTVHENGKFAGRLALVNYAAGGMLRLSWFADVGPSDGPNGCFFHTGYMFEWRLK